MFTSDVRKAGKEDINKLLREHKELTQLEFLDVGGRALLNKNSDGDFQFAHRTFQEFLVVQTLKQNWGWPDRKQSSSMMDSFILIAGLRDADLSGANLSGADLRDADLVDAIMTGTNLRGAYLVDAFMNGADLSGADLRGADLGDTTLMGADLSGAYLGDEPGQGN